MTELGLPYVGQGQAVLADGSEAVFDVYGVTVLWDGQPRYVEADEADATPLAGMLLLAGHTLYMEIEDDGRVVIQAKE